MAKAKTPSKSAPSASIDNDALLEAIAVLSDKVAALTDQVEVLRVALDDLRVEVEHAIRNVLRPAWAPTQQITSLPRDPLAENFAEKVNRVRPSDLPADNDQVPETPPPAAPTELF